MPELPEAAARQIVRGVASYVRATPATELPKPLAALKKTVQTAKGEGRHRTRLLSVLDDDAARALILEWLEEGKPALAKEEAAALKLAVERPEGWIDRLVASVPAPAEEVETRGAADLAELERKLQREKEAHRKAREEAKRAKEAERRAVKVERGRSLRLDEMVSDQKRHIGELTKDLTRATARSARAEKEAERLQRKARSDSDLLRQQVRRLRDENRELKKRLNDLEREAKVRSRSDAKKTSASPRPEPPQEQRRVRPMLKVPKGRLEDAAETLRSWLEVERVTLLVDGYNVTRSAAGFGHVTLEQQRDRLREMLKALSNRFKVPTVVVWDGGDVAPGTRRPTAGYLTEEYSQPDRSGMGTDKDRADRHIVALLGELAADPVILVTDDRALQEAARTRKATIATSEQLLALLR